MTEDGVASVVRCEYITRDGTGCSRRGRFAVREKGAPDEGLPAFACKQHARFTKQRGEDVRELGVWVVRGWLDEAFR